MNPCVYFFNDQFFYNSSNPYENLYNPSNQFTKSFASPLPGVRYMNISLPGSSNPTPISMPVKPIKGVPRNNFLSLGENPPCNTLYVGNLPMNTSEEELRLLFMKCPGYKRMSFRTKANGPMCFVEFEDVQCATSAMNEYYGTLLSTSTKGGIRLSYSKNPLGVRPFSLKNPSPESAIPEPKILVLSK